MAIVKELKLGECIVYVDDACVVTDEEEIKKILDRASEIVIRALMTLEETA